MLRSWLFLAVLLFTSLLMLNSCSDSSNDSDHEATDQSQFAFQIATNRQLLVRLDAGRLNLSMSDDSSRISATYARHALAKSDAEAQALLQEITVTQESLANPQSIRIHCPLDAQATVDLNLVVPTHMKIVVQTMVVHVEAAGEYDSLWIEVGSGDLYYRGNSPTFVGLVGTGNVDVAGEYDSLGLSVVTGNILASARTKYFTASVSTGDLTASHQDWLPEGRGTMSVNIGSLALHLPEPPTGRTIYATVGTGQVSSDYPTITTLDESVIADCRVGVGSLVIRR